MHKLFHWILMMVSLVYCGCGKNMEHAASTTDVYQENAPKYWMWLGYKETDDYHVICKRMADTGVRGLLLSAPIEGYKKVIPIAEKYGIDVHAWGWIMNCTDKDFVAKHPEYLSVNREGKSLAEQKAYVDYYKFLCPSIPEVRQYLTEHFRKICQIRGLKGVSLDYCRYVDVILPKGLWETYGIVQDKEYAQWDYGYHPHTLIKFKNQYGYDPSNLDDPSLDEKWVQFRCDQITEVAVMLGKVAKEYGLPISASPFPTPTIAKKMVRQDWGKWKLDFAFPMIYHEFYLEDRQWVIDCVQENVKLDFPIYCGLHAPDFNEKSEVSLSMMMASALKYGAKGIAIYSYEALSEKQWEELKAFILQNP